MNYIISIKPKYASLIYNGVKLYEIRTRIPKLRFGDCIYIYETAPISKVTGYFVYQGYLIESPTNAWVKYRHDLGVTEEEWRSYTSGHETIVLLSCYYNTKLIAPLSLKHFHLTYPPQWFVKLHNL